MRVCEREYHRALRTVVLVAAMLWLGAGAVQAQTATNLKCDGCVASGDIKNGGVKTFDIRAGAVNTSRLEDGAVTKRKIASGAVTGVKIADGAIGAAKLGLTNTFYLEDSGSNTVNCDNLREVLIGLNGPAAVVLGPGTFDCGEEIISLRDQVSLIGSGQNLTTITGGTARLYGLVSLGDSSALVDLTVVNDGRETPGNRITAVVITGGENWLLRNVTAKAISGRYLSTAILGRADACGGEMVNVKAIAETTGFAVGIQLGCNAEPIFASNLTARAVGTIGAGLYKSGSSTMTARNSSFEGPDSVYVLTGFLKVIASELNGPVLGTIICVGAYDETGTALTDDSAGLGGCL